MSFILLDYRPQYRLASGALCANGQLVFTATGTSTPEDVFAEAGLTTNLGNVIDLDADARSPTPLWGSDTAYRVELLDSLGATVAGYPVDDIAGGDFGGITIPDPTSGTDGQVIATDGSVYGLRTFREPPDPTGQDQKMLVVSGDEYVLVAQPTIPDVELPDGGVTLTTSILTIGDWVIQQGTGSLPASGTTTSTAAIVFASSGGIACDSCQHVDVSMAAPFSGGFEIAHHESSLSGTGFSTTGCINVDAPGTFTTTYAFTWTAWCKKAVA
jgi:hypothetical protein